MRERERERERELERERAREGGWVYLQVFRACLEHTACMRVKE